MDHTKVGGRGTHPEGQVWSQGRRVEVIKDGVLEVWELEACRGARSGVCGRGLGPGAAGSPLSEERLSSISLFRESICSSASLILSSRSFVLLQTHRGVRGAGQTQVSWGRDL